MRIFNLFILSILIFSSCEIKVQEKKNEYTNLIYSWFVINYPELEIVTSIEKEDIWYLFFDDKITCDTCKLEILSKVRNNKSVIIITNFGNERHLEQFKKNYKLKNNIINLTSINNNLSIPFFFKLDGNRMYELHILDDEFLMPSPITKIIGIN